jgi:hypothetical protein
MEWGGYGWWCAWAPFGLFLLSGGGFSFLVVSILEGLLFSLSRGLGLGLGPFDIPNCNSYYITMITRRVCLFNGSLFCHGKRVNWVVSTSLFGSLCFENTTNCNVPFVNGIYSSLGIVQFSIIDANSRNRIVGR